MKNTLYCLVDKFVYKDGIFGAGIVKNSIHPSDKLFLQINRNIFELRNDEANAIISSLAKVLWCNYQYTKKDIRDKLKLKWKTKKQLDKDWDRKNNCVYRKGRG